MSHIKQLYKNAIKKTCSISKESMDQDFKVRMQTYPIPEL